MRSVILVFFVAIIILPSTFVYAQRDRDTFTTIQPIEIMGYVRTGSAGEPARNVPVRLERFSGGVVEQMQTDNQGRFRFGGLGRGSYAVIIEAPEFEPVRQTADLSVLFKVLLVFELAPRKSGRRSDSGFGVVDARVPESAQSEYAKGHAALLDKKPKEAVRYLEKAVALYEDFFEARLLLGTALMDLREWPEAQHALLRAVEVKPESAAAMLALGEVYWRQKRYDDAERSLTEGLKLDDENWHGHFTLSRLYWDKGDLMKAAPAVGRTVQLKPDFAEAHLLAGNILLKLGHPQRALVEYEEYVRLAPKGEFADQTRTLIQKIKTTIKPQ